MTFTPTATFTLKQKGGLSDAAHALTSAQKTVAPIVGQRRSDQWSDARSGREQTACVGARASCSEASGVQQHQDEIAPVMNFAGATDANNALKNETLYDIVQIQ